MTILTTIHTQRYDSWMGTWLAQAEPLWAKIVNPDAGFVLPNVANSLVRIWTDNVDASYIARGREGGKAYVDTLYPRWSQNPATVYSLWNEPDVNTNTGLANLNEATLGAIDEAVHLGIRVVVGEWAEGNPHNNNTGDESVTAWKLAQLRPSLKAAADNGMWFGRHCYGRPLVEDLTGRWHALGRLEWDLNELNIPNLRTLVTEIGVDGGIAGHTGEQGWQKLDTGPMSASEYLAWIVNAEPFARKIGGVEALMYFGFGSTDKWLAGGFDISEGFASTWIAPLRALGDATVTETDEIEDSSGHLRIELARPVSYASTRRVSQWFGDGQGNYDDYELIAHNGLDYPAPLGSPVMASHPGIAYTFDQGDIGFGKYVRIHYFDGKGKERYKTYYAHLSEFKVTNGAKVKRGQVIGLSGSTGNSTGPHVHWQLRIIGMANPGYGDAVDPSPFRTVPCTE